MSCGAYPSATVRIMDIKRFVQDFIRDYKPDLEGIQTPLDVFTWVFGEVYCVSPKKRDANWILTIQTETAVKSLILGRVSIPLSGAMTAL